MILSPLPIHFLSLHRNNLLWLIDHKELHPSKNRHACITHCRRITQGRKDANVSQLVLHSLSSELPRPFVHLCELDVLVEIGHISLSSGVTPPFISFL